ncbi:hypothetical protein E4T56_gene11835 [Termitomyces sp. T112]|nr:hypothetical protein E4T56_gene11835 [Termitomyces sp. T112]
MLLTSVLPYASYPREFQWILMPPNSNSLLLYCVDAIERLVTLPITVLKSSAQDATGMPSPNMFIAVPSNEAANILEEVPAELEKDF